MTWIDNSIMFWHDGTAFRKITDHGRAPLSVSVERFERSNRMVDATMRRYSVKKKRTWSTNWEMLPSTNSGGAGTISAVDGGYAGEDIETFHDDHDGAFQMQLRSGDETIETVTVMITDFTKEVVKRGPKVDLWNLSITLTEV